MQISIDEVRCRINDIDDNILRMLDERSILVEQIGRLKKQYQVQASAFRPAREAQIIRRILANISSNYPVKSTIHIWREMIATFCTLQKSFSVAYYTEQEGEYIRDLTRFYYGSMTQLTKCSSMSQVLQAISKDDFVIGIVPEPDYEANHNSWWLSLLSNKKNIYVVNVQPFIRFNNEDCQTNYYALANCLLEPSGDDMTMGILVTSSQASRTMIVQNFKDNKLQARTLSVFDNSETHQRFHLVEMSGFFEKEYFKEEIKRVFSGNKPIIQDVFYLGSYPKQIDIIEKKYENS